MPRLASPHDVAALREKFNLSASEATMLLEIGNFSVDNAIEIYEPGMTFGDQAALLPPAADEPAAAEPPQPPHLPQPRSHKRSPTAIARRRRLKHRNQKEDGLLRAVGLDKDFGRRADQHMSEQRRQRAAAVAFARGRAAEKAANKQRRAAKRKQKKQAKLERKAGARAARRGQAARGDF